MNTPFEPTVPSPCRDVCRLDQAGICIGCGRTIAEIAAWPRADAARRLAIRAAARQRIAGLLESEQRRELVDPGAR